MKAKTYNIIRYGAKTLAVLPLFIVAFLFTACSDEPDTSNYYTFKGEMMSTYLKTHEQFSDYAAIVDRAGLMDLLSAYGHYTCFAPTNDAIQAYLKSRGMNSVSDLSDADCDTIARTHLVENMFATSEMNDGTLTTANMNKRFIEITHDFDNDSNGVVRLNRDAILQAQDRIGGNESREARFLLIGSSGCLLVDVRCVLDSRIQCMVVRLVDVSVKRILKVRVLQGLIEEADAGVVLQHVGQHA